ncbi:conserved hypothetical protein [Deferribacter desulfuricans SSM1]|uniref:Inner membrane protein YgaP-like transmembrane domain-containing protein n=1 Tax=Deferribacter desulfuricans (strain DSM 14783 / JCM 11476 / NBRC 101012 / SSM1) TaxID=639282 RepID=D3PAE5_DEFDS|nr:DUF2892 domain-containing protein [Deferribacter desulfuricans]BAI79568.1 conserved hypothetical protein [Deferribacter desulfuricans SSM1]
MTVKALMRIIPGLFVTISVILGLTVNKWWFAFTLFVGLNLFQSGFTNFCPLEIFLKKMGIPEE